MESPGKRRPNHGRPLPLNETVTRQMKKMPRRGSGPELRLRRELFRRGLRFRVNVGGLPGSPDIVFTAARIAVFVDGCFWHGCPIHATSPKNNRRWWEEKIAANRERDRRKDLELERLGWTSLHYWEHDDTEEIADEIEWLWRQLR
nr:DNA mismatch endonuclease Vsr [Corynebacterium sp. TAE3-ERU16]